MGQIFNDYEDYRNYNRIFSASYYTRYIYCSSCSHQKDEAQIINFSIGQNLNINVLRNRYCNTCKKFRFFLKEDEYRYNAELNQLSFRDQNFYQN